MGHFKIKLVPADEVSRDASMTVKLQRLGELDDGTGRARRTFGPPDPGSGGDCVAECAELDFTTDPEVFAAGDPRDYLVWPTEASVLCEGDCLEWSMELAYSGEGSPPEPNITMEPGEDCVGVIVHVDDTAENLAGWSFTLTATLDSAPFCDPITITMTTPVDPSTFLYSTEDGVTATNVPSYDLAPDCEALWAGIAWLLTTPPVGDYDIGLFAWNASQTGSGFSVTEDVDGFGQPRITISPLLTMEEMCTNGETLTIAPTYDGAPANGPLSVTFSL